jgi:hypothetical protein
MDGRAAKSSHRTISVRVAGQYREVLAEVLAGKFDSIHESNPTSKPAQYTGKAASR